MRRGHPDPEALLQCWGLSWLSSNTIKTTYQGDCSRLLIFYANVASSRQVRRSSVLVLVSDCKKDIKLDNILISGDDIDESIKCDDLSPSSLSTAADHSQGF